jgi:hypothetical protein
MRALHVRAVFKKQRRGKTGQAARFWALLWISYVSLIGEIC